MVSPMTFNKLPAQKGKIIEKLKASLIIWLKRKIRVVT
jgi:hypothetical protein